MTDDNKRNVHYFEAGSMRALFADLDQGQEANQTRFLSLSIQRDGPVFACIALTNPTEVVICSGYAQNQASVLGWRLRVDGT